MAPINRHPDRTGSTTATSSGPDALEEGKKALCVCDWSGAAAALEEAWPGSERTDGSLRQIESGAALAAALRGRAGSPDTPDGRRSVLLLRDVVAADRRRGFRFFGMYSRRAAYLDAEAFLFDGAYGRSLAREDPAAGLRWVDAGLDLFRDFPFRWPPAAGLWVERARYLSELGRTDEAREAAETALRAERAGETASPSSIAADFELRREATELLAQLSS